MADDYVSIIMQVFIWMAFTIVVFGPFVLAFVFRNRVSFWPGRKVIEVWYYSLKPGKEMDKTGHVDENDCTLTRRGSAWRIVDKKIPWIWLQTAKLNGLQLDAAGLALLRNYDKPTLRLLELSPENKTDPATYVFMDVPKELDAQQVSTAVSTMANSLIKTCKAELTRPQKDTTLIDAIIGVMPYIAAIFIILLVLNWAQGQMASTVDLGTKQLSEVCRNAVMSINWTNVTNPTSPAPAMPFKVG